MQKSRATSKCQSCVYFEAPWSDIMTLSWLMLDIILPKKDETQDPGDPAGEFCRGHALTSINIWPG